MTNVVINKQSNPVKDVVHKVGNFYLNEDGQLFILAQIGCDELSLITIIGGNRWGYPRNVVDINDVCDEDFYRCGGEGFTLLENVTITI